SDKIKLDQLPLGPVGTVSRLIYRTKANGNAFLFVAKLSNTDANPATYTDTMADIALGASLKGFAAPDVSANGNNTQRKAQAGAGSMTAATYEYRFQFYRFDANGKLVFSDASASATVVLGFGNKSLTLGNVPLGPAGTQGRVVFRRELTGTAKQFRLLDYIQNNTQTDFPDATPD